MQFTPETVIELERSKQALRLADFLADDGFKVDMKYRCQTPFRDSRSWNGILRKYANGAASLHDNGTGITYWYNPDPTRGVNDESLAEGVEQAEALPQARHLCTDQANADRLLKAAGTKVMFAAGRWYFWKGTHWSPDEAAAYLLQPGRFTCREAERVKCHRALPRAFRGATSCVGR